MLIGIPLGCSAYFRAPLTFGLFGVPSACSAYHRAVWCNFRRVSLPGTVRLCFGTLNYTISSALPVYPLYRGLQFIPTIPMLRKLVLSNFCTSKCFYSNNCNLTKSNLQLRAHGYRITFIGQRRSKLLAAMKQ